MRFTLTLPVRAISTLNPASHPGVLAHSSTGASSASVTLMAFPPTQAQYHLHYAVKWERNREMDSSILTRYPVLCSGRRTRIFPWRKPEHHPVSEIEGGVHLRRSRAAARCC